MKKTIATLIISVALLTKLSAQETLFVPKNEIKLNLLTSILGLPEISYERLVRDDIGVGFSTSFAYEFSNFDALGFMALPFGRVYFGKKAGAGFYIEANSGVITAFEKCDDSNIVKKSSIGVEFGFGVAVGYKFLTKENWVGDIFSGGGRAFGSIVDGGYPRIGISFGKRF